MQMKDMFGPGDEAGQPSNSRYKWKQKALAAGILGTISVGAFVAVDVAEKEPARKATTETALITLRPDGTDKDVLIARYDANFVALRSEIEDVRREAAATEARLRGVIADQKAQLETQSGEVKDLKAIAGRAGLTPRPGETPEETEARIKALLKANDDAAYIAKLSSQFGSRKPGKVFHTDISKNDPAGTPADMPDSSPTLPDISQGVKAPPEAVSTTRQPSSGSRLVMVTLPAPGAPAPAAPRVGPGPSINPDKPLAMNRAAGTTVADYLPAGSFVRARLLTGVYASTGAGAASQPLPMVIRLEDTAVLPNAWRSQVTACHVTASATGDLSSERAFVRLDRLSCVGKKGEALDVRVSGYAVGEDGKVGIRGRLVTRSGQAIASALSVGLLSGLGESVTRSSEEVTTSITGTQSKRYTNAWLSGMGEGLSDAMNRITDYYLRLADRIFPVLEVDAGRPVDLVFSQGVLLADPSKR